MNESINIEECRVTYRWLKWALLTWAAPMSFIILNVVPKEHDWYNYTLGLHMFGALGLFVSLGRLASYSNRNWVHFGLLPVLVPIVGPLVSYAFILRVGKQAGWR